MATEIPGAQMLLEGMDMVRAHLSDWGRREGATPAENLASGWIVGVITEQILSLRTDSARRDAIDQMAPAFLETIRSMREAEERG